MAFGPNFLNQRPDPVLTNVMRENSSQGGWLAPVLCGIRPVSADYVRHARQDDKSLLSNFMDTLRTPGSRANLLARPVKEWVTSLIQEDAVRVEYFEEDVRNSISPEEPAVNSAKKVTNVLQYAFELAVAQAYNPANWAAANKTAAGHVWNGSGTAIETDIENAVVTIAERSGLEPNYIRIPRKKWGGIKSCAEITGLRTGQDPIEYQNGVPFRFFGLRILFGTPRQDTTSTGTFTPAFLWDKSTLNLDDTVHIGYSPFLNGGSWNGTDQVFLGCFENQTRGTAYAAAHRLDPNYEENGVHIVWGSVRRSLPEVFNADSAFAITTI